MYENTSFMYEKYFLFHLQAFFLLVWIGHWLSEHVRMGD